MEDIEKLKRAVILLYTILKDDIESKETLGMYIDNLELKVLINDLNESYETNNPITIASEALHKRTAELRKDEAYRLGFMEGRESEQKRIVKILTSLYVNDHVRADLIERITKTDKQ